MHQQPGGPDPGGHLGERVLDRLLPDQRRAVHLAGGRPGDRSVEGRLRHPDRERADAGPEQVEGAHGDREAAVHLTEYVVRGDPDPVEHEAADRVRGHHVEGLTGQPVRVTGDDERGHPTGSCALGGAGEDAVDVGLGRVGDPELLAGQPPAVDRRRVAVGPQGQPCGVGAGVRLGQGEAGDGLAGDHTRDPALDRGRLPRLQDRVAPEPLEGQRGLRLGGDGGEGLAQQAQLHRGRVPRSLLGCPAEQAAQEAVVSERAQQRPVDGPVDGRDLRQVLAGHPAHPGDVLPLARAQGVGVLHHAADAIAP